MVTGRDQVTVVPGPPELAESGARLVSEMIGAAVERRGACYLALAGGGTPRACYERLARVPYAAQVPWSKVHAFWSDERLVPLDDPESNYGMAKTALLDHVPIPSEQVHPAPVDVRPPGTAAAAYQRELRMVPAEAGRPCFDLILLGMGEDGHTASLFPGDPALRERRALVRAVHASKPPSDRLTFTLPLINAARSVVFLVQGMQKRDSLAAALRQDPGVPAGMVRPERGALRFLVDREAFPGP